MTSSSSSSAACPTVDSHKYNSYKEHEDEVEEELVDQSYGNLGYGCIQ